MKCLLSILFFLFGTTAFSQKSYTLKPDAQGYLIVDNKSGVYKAGDTLFLRGYFKAVAVQNLSGAAGAAITITNYPGETLIIGDSTWPGGSWGHGLAIRNCHYLNVGGTTKDNFKIIGSNSTKLDANGYPVKTAYLDLMITELSDNFIVHDIMIRHGGVGLLCKTDVSATNSKTWYPNTWLENFEFYNLDIYDTYNEAMYIGHTAAWWNIKTNQPYYGTTTDYATYKLPIKLRNLKVHHNNLHTIWNDAIQIAAADNVEVYNNEVVDWGVKKEYPHSGGILIGGRISGFDVHDNYVHDGWGEMVQVFADSGRAIVRNNLLVKNKLSGVSVRGTKGLVVEFLNNTVAYSGEYAFRINGTSGGTGKNLLRKNLIVQPGSGRFYYLENGGAMTDNDNKTFALASQVGWLETNYYQPLATSTAVGYGYVVMQTPVPDPVPQPTPGLKLSITLPQISLDKLTEGSHVLKLTLPDGKVAFITIVVEKIQ